MKNFEDVEPVLVKSRHSKIHCLFIQRFLHFWFVNVRTLKGHLFIADRRTTSIMRGRVLTNFRYVFKKYSINVKTFISKTKRNILKRQVYYKNIRIRPLRVKICAKKEITARVHFEQNFRRKTHRVVAEYWARTLRGTTLRAARFVAPSTTRGA